MSKPTKNEPELIAAGALLPNVIAGETLMPNSTAAPAEERFWHWFGLTEDSPLGCVHVAGIAFSRSVESVLPDHVGIRRVRVPHAGSIIALTRTQLRLLGERLPHRIIRMVTLDRVEDGKQAQGAILVVTPRPEEVVANNEAKKTGAPFRHLEVYTAREGDVPLAAVAYCVWLDSTSPKPRSVDAELPEPLSVTGIVIPPLGARAVPPTEQLTAAKLPKTS